MQTKTAGRRPRHAIDNDNGHVYADGYAVEIETADGRQKLEWYPGDVYQAVAAARAQFPGCRIEGTEMLGWECWLLVLEDAEALRQERVAVGLDDEDDAEPLYPPRPHP